MGIPAFNIQKEAVNRPQWKTLQQFQSYTQFQKSQTDMLDTAEKQRQADYDRTRRARIEQDRIQREQDQFVINQYARVGKLQETGSAPFDTSKDEYFNDQIEKYVTIANAMNNHTIDPNKGARALAEINGRVQQFKDMAPELLANAKILEEAYKIPKGQPGSVSVLNAPDQQQVILNLIHGGDVRLLEHDGQMVLFSPPGSENLPEGGMINVNELTNLMATGKEYIQLVPNIDTPLQSALQSIVGGVDGNYNLGDSSTDQETGDEIGKFMTVSTEELGDKTVTVRTMNAEQQQNIATSLASKDLFNTLIDTHGKTIWADLMGKDEPFDPNENSVEMKEFLADEAINKFAAEVGIQHIQGDVKDKSDKPRSQRSIDRGDAHRGIRHIAPIILKSLQDLNPRGLANLKVLNETISQSEFATDDADKVIPGKIIVGKSGKFIGAEKGIDITDRQAIINMIVSTYGNEHGKFVTELVDKWYKDQGGFAKVKKKFEEDIK